MPRSLGIYASSRHIPGVRFPGLIHPGLIGTAPSAELLGIWNARERGLVEGPEPTLASVLHTRPLAALPETKGACLGLIPEGTPEWARVAAEGARTVPGRENGGNWCAHAASHACCAAALQANKHAAASHSRIPKCTAATSRT